MAGLAARPSPPPPPPITSTVTGRKCVSFVPPFIKGYSPTKLPVHCQAGLSGGGQRDNGEDQGGATQSEGGGNEEGVGREDQPSGRKRGRKDDKGTDLSDSDHL